MDYSPTKKNARFLRIAAQQSSNSYMQHKHGGRVVSYGYNYYKSPNAALSLGKYSMHAEIDALNRLGFPGVGGKKQKGGEKI